MEKKNILFLINPVSGGYSKKKLHGIIAREVDQQQYNLRIVETRAAEEADELTTMAVQQDFFMVTAVGGDGTINNIARHLTGSNTALGIIPAGSGNGYARSLGIPLQNSKALQCINRGKTIRVDTGLMNGRTFVNVAGIGFDAHVAHCFQQTSNRGFLNYVSITLKEFSSFEPVTMQIENGALIKSEKAFLASICLGQQYGNNAYIAPKADLCDGLFDVTIIRKADLIRVPGIVWKLFSRSFSESDNIHMFTSASVRIQLEQPVSVHLDGDPAAKASIIDFMVNPLSLQVVV
jgi:diacylglycerol kinase (ATP)